MRKMLIFIILVLFLIGCSSKETLQPADKVTGNVVVDTSKETIGAKEEAETDSKTICRDSDKGIATEKAGKVTGIDEEGNEYTLYDRCGGRTNILVEYYCSEGKPTNKNIRCTTDRGCKAGACR